MMERLGFIHLICLRKLLIKYYRIYGFMMDSQRVFRGEDLERSPGEIFSVQMLQGPPFS